MWSQNTSHKLLAPWREYMRLQIDKQFLKKKIILMLIDTDFIEKTTSRS